MFKGEPSARGAGRKRGAWFLKRPPKHQSVESPCWSDERGGERRGQPLKKRAGGLADGQLQAACVWTRFSCIGSPSVLKYAPSMDQPAAARTLCSDASAGSPSFEVVPSTAAGWLPAAEIRGLSHAVGALLATLRVPLTCLTMTVCLRLTASLYTSSISLRKDSVLRHLSWRARSHRNRCNCHVVHGVFHDHQKLLVDSCRCHLSRQSWRTEHNYRCQVKISLCAAIISSLSTSRRMASQRSQVR
jgi:hypothetical protein